LANRNIKVNIFPKSTGRPPLDQETIDLILRLKKLNPNWGGQRISDELKKIGYKVSKPTVLNYLEIYGLHTPPFLKGLKWSEFLSNHSFKIGIDFTSLIDIKGNQLFIFVILNLDSRKLIFINATYSHNKQWLIQQFKNAFFDINIYPSLCLCDNDTVFGNWFKPIMKSYFELKILKIPFKCPWINGKVERLNLSLKKEAFYNVIPINLEHTIKRCRMYQKYYNSFRPHQAIDGRTPELSENVVCFRSKFIEKSHLEKSITTFELQIFLVA
jgi:putative transposase